MTSWRFWKKKTSPEDVRFLFLLCLGTEAEAEVEYRQRSGKSLHGTMSSLLGSNTFRKTVLSVAASEDYLPHHALDREQTVAVIEGLRKHLGVSLPSAFEGNWFDLLARASQSSRYRKAAGNHHSKAILDDFTEALKHLSKREASPALGALDDVTGMTCRGWAVDPTEPKQSLRLNFYINNHFIGQITSNQMRRDLQELYGGDGLFGFEQTLTLPAALADAKRLVLKIKDANTGAYICPGKEIIGDALANIGLLQQASQLMASDKFEEQATGLDFALPSLSSFKAFPLEQYCVFTNAHEISAPKHIYKPQTQFTIILCGDLSDRDARQISLDSIDNQNYVGRITTLEAENTEDILTVAKAAAGDFILFLKAGDRLHPLALDWFAYRIEKDDKKTLIYCDHDILTGTRQYRDHPALKPRFDYNFLLSANYITDTYVINREKLNSVGPVSTSSLAIFHLDLQLHLYEEFGASGFGQISEVLWHKTKSADDAISSGVVADHLKRIKVQATVSDTYQGDFPVHGNVIEWPIDETLPKLAIVIPTRNGYSLIKPCVDSLISTLEYPDATEIIIIDNGSDDEQTLNWLSEIEQHDLCTVIRDPSPFNWSAINNHAAMSTNAEYLLFLNDDTLALEKGWDHILRGHLNRPEIGVIGARLLYSDGTIQHAGVILYEAGVARHEAAGQSIYETHYMKRSQTPHECAAVTGAFLACRHDDFNALGGFNADNLGIIFNDIDFCLRMREAKKSVLFTPRITFNHLESKTRGFDDQDDEKAKRAKVEADWMRERWGNSLREDRYYPSAFSRLGKPFQGIDLYR